MATALRMGRFLAPVDCSKTSFEASRETPMPTNTQILLDHRPTDKVSPANFRIIEAPVPAPGPGEVLVRHSFCRSIPTCAGASAKMKGFMVSDHLDLWPKAIGERAALARPRN